MVFLRDTMKQFHLMNIPLDYGRITQGDGHRQREKQRLEVLKTRIEYARPPLADTKDTNVNEALKLIETVAESSLDSDLSQVDLDQKYYSDKYIILGDKVKAAFTPVFKIEPKDKLSF